MKENWEWDEVELEEVTIKFIQQGLDTKNGTENRNSEEIYQ